MVKNVIAVWALAALAGAIIISVMLYDVGKANAETIRALIPATVAAAELENAESAKRAAQNAALFTAVMPAITSSAKAVIYLVTVSGIALMAGYGFNLRIAMQKKAARPDAQIIGDSRIVLASLPNGRNVAIDISTMRVVDLARESEASETMGRVAIAGSHAQIEGERPFLQMADGGSNGLVQIND